MRHRRNSGRVIAQKIRSRVSLRECKHFPLLRLQKLERLEAHLEMLSDSLAVEFAGHPRELDLSVQRLVREASMGPLRDLPDFPPRSRFLWRFPINAALVTLHPHSESCTRGGGAATLSGCASYGTPSCPSRPATRASKVAPRAERNRLRGERGIGRVTAASGAPPCVR